MPNITEKTYSNVFYQARCEASKHNEQLSSREGAADMMSVNRGRLYQIEKGVVNPYPEEVHMMADLYHAPELRNYFCREKCPLGIDIPKVDTGNLDRISVKAFAILRKLDETQEMLLDITEDGVITEEEKPVLRKILETLDGLEQVAQSLKVWVKKNIQEG